MNLVFNKTIITSKEIPTVIERRKDNTCLYKYDLQEIATDTEELKYSYVPVVLKGYPNRNEAIKGLLRKLVTLEDELKLINDFNEAVENDELKSPEYTEYIKYLEFRKEIKQKVKTDFTNAGY